MKKYILSITLLFTFFISLHAQSTKEGLKAIDFERYEFARDNFKQVIMQEPKKGDNYYYLGQSYINLLQTDSALLAYNLGIIAEPINTKNYIGIGEILLNENKVPEAKGYFEKALAISRGKDGRSTDAITLAMVASAMVSGETKLLDDALTNINEALELNKKNYDILVMAGDVMLERNEGGPSATFFEKAIDLDKNNPKAYARVAGIWLRVKNAEATLTALTKALAIDSNYAPALKSMAEYYYQIRKYEKAKETYIKYLKNSEESNANKIRFAQILFNTKEYEEALKKIEEIQKTDKNNVYLFRMAGYSCYEVAEAKKDTSKYRLGISSIETFFEKIDPKKIISSDYEYYGKLLSRVAGRENDALLNFGKVLGMDSSKIEIYPEMGRINNKLKKFNEAAANFEYYLSKNKNPNTTVYYLMSLGRSLYFGKQYGRADTAFMKVNELKPDYAEAFLFRGHSNAALETDTKEGKAKEFYEKYIALAEPAADKNKPGLLIAYDYLATFYVKRDDKKLDDTNSAKSFYNKILALDPENKTAKENIKLLTQQKAAPKK